MIALLNRLMQKVQLVFSFGKIDFENSAAVIITNEQRKK